MRVCPVFCTSDILNKLDIRAAEEGQGLGFSVPQFVEGRVQTN